MYWSIIVSVVIALSCFLLGLFILLRLKIIDLSALDKFCFSFALGFGLIGNLYMLLGFIGLYKRPVILLIPFLIIILCAPLFNEFVVILKYLWNKTKEEIRTNKIWSAIGILFLFIYFIKGFLPPIGFDALMYHLSVPKLYIEHGGFYDVFFNPQSNLVMLTEMVFVPILATGNGTGCSFLSFINGCMLMFSTALIGKRLLSLKSGIVVSIIFLSLTNTMANFSVCNVDFTMALFAVLAFYAAYRINDKNGIILLILLSGFCVQSKVHGFFSLISIGIAVIFNENRKKIFAGLFAGLIFGLPLLIKSHIYSFSFSPAESTGLTSIITVQDNASIVVHWFKIFFDLIKRVLISPWSFSIIPDLHRMDTFGPLFIILIPGIFLIKKKRKAMPFLLFALGYVICISIFEIIAFSGYGASIRYSAPLLALLCPLAVFAWQEGLNLQRATKAISTVIVFLVIILNLIICFKRYREEIHSVLTMQPQSRYLEKTLKEYPVINFANKNLSIKDTIMTSTCFSTYYIDVPYFCAYKSYDDLNKMYSDFNKIGIKYLFANDILDTSENIKAWQGDSLKMVFKENGFYLYKINKKEY